MPSHDPRRKILSHGNLWVLAIMYFFYNYNLNVYQDWYATYLRQSKGMTLAQMKIKGMDKPYFSKGERVACVRPTGWSCIADTDDLNRGRRKLTLRFELPRGSYATMLVKRITSLELPST